MAVSQRVKILTEKAEELAVLKAFIEDPDLIDELVKETKKINSLGEDEAVKLQEAKDFMANKDEIFSDLEAQRKELAEATASFEAQMEAVSKTNEAESQRLSDLKSSLADKETALTKREKEVSVLMEEVTVKEKALQKDFDSAMDKVKDGAEKNKLDAVANRDLAAQLETLRQKLKAKADAMREQADDL